METIDPGELRHRIEIVSYVESGQDSAGFSAAAAEVVVARPWAKVTVESGSTALSNGSEFATTRKRFLIRTPSAEITTDMFVRHKGNLHKITRPPCDYGDLGIYTEIWTEETSRY